MLLFQFFFFFGEISKMRGLEPKYSLRINQSISQNKSFWAFWDFTKIKQFWNNNLVNFEQLFFHILPSDDFNFSLNCINCPFLIFFPTICNFGKAIVIFYTNNYNSCLYRTGFWILRHFLLELPTMWEVVWSWFS